MSPHQSHFLENAFTKCFCARVQLIVEAKVNMIRDAQCSEKSSIRKEVGAEEKRLDDEMEVDRVNAIRIEEEIARKRKNERMIGAMMIMDQIKHNEQVPRLPSTRPRFVSGRRVT